MSIISKIKNKAKKNNAILYCMALIYTVVHFSIPIKAMLLSSITWKGAFLRRTTFKIKGKNCRIEIEPMARISNCSFYIGSDKCKIRIGGNHTIISNVSFWIEGENSIIDIAPDFTMEGGHIACTESSHVYIGKDCMFSSDIEIRTGDSHAIISIETNKRINQAKDIIIGDHVWLGAHVRVLNGSKISNNCIVGNSSVVTSVLAPSNSIFCGVPSKLVKSGIDWNRKI